MTYAEFLALLPAKIGETQVRTAAGADVNLVSALYVAKVLFLDAHISGGKVIFVGNGGSGAIASHMAIDYTKNGGIRSVALNDHPTLTCVANDFGYEQVFAKQIEFYAMEQDVVVIISTSGRSPNILEAAKAARKRGCDLVTLSGMRPDNELRTQGNINFYVPSDDYGIVEIAHLTLLHSMVSAK